MILRVFEALRARRLALARDRRALARRRAARSTRDDLAAAAPHRACSAYRRPRDGRDGRRAGRSDSVSRTLPP